MMPGDLHIPYDHIFAAKFRLQKDILVRVMMQEELLADMYSKIMGIEKSEVKAKLNNRYEQICGELHDYLLKEFGEIDISDLIKPLEQK